LKFFIDTANVDDIREAESLGILDGVTTNPSLIAKEKRPYNEIVSEICDIVDGPVSVEVTATKHKDMLSEGLKLAALDEKIVVKLPLTLDGLKTCAALAGQDIDVNMTLCFSTGQALLAAKAGAAYISPFVGRLDDISHDGMQLIRDIVEIYNNYLFETEVLVASVRHPIHVYEAALAGADVATIPLKVIEMMIKHPLTDIGLNKFLADWEKTGQKI